MNYVCASCFGSNLKYEKEKEIYICKNCGAKKVAELDDLIAESIKLLNILEYKTRYSCEGHYIHDNMVTKPRIQFKRKYPILKELYSLINAYNDFRCEYSQSRGLYFEFEFVNREDFNEKKTKLFKIIGNYLWRKLFEKIKNQAEKDFDYKIVVFRGSSYEMRARASIYFDQKIININNFYWDDSKKLLLSLTHELGHLLSYIRNPKINFDNLKKHVGEFWAYKYG